MNPVLAIEAPEGAVLEFALLFAVILLGPAIVERAKVPGIIGLLLGGYVIGSHGTGLIDAGNQTIPELGQLGLLYLMFVAGLELDLALLGAYRRAAITFGVLTFALPFAAGVGVGMLQGWETNASLLLGSLLASHTLILYPTIRDAGRAANPAVASAVGATVLTDTLALVVLAGVAGTATGEGSTAAVLAEVFVGLVVLVVVGFTVLPRLARAALGLWGGDRAARYVVSVLAFLVMAMVAEVFGIEGIVGAFFAGLALNRLVPNHGPSMERIEFFGSALFIPVFLVSVGLLLDPAVMFTGETLGVAALLCLACLGGKAVAAALMRPLLGFSGPETGVMFVLTTPQAAATLAATLVGFEIGIFGVVVVNAVLVLILVSILVSILLAERFAAAVPVPADRVRNLGDRVLVAAGAAGPSPAALRVADLVASVDGGVVDVVVVHTEEEAPLSAGQVAALEAAIFRGPMDGEVRVVVGSDVAVAVQHAALGLQPSTLIVDASVTTTVADWQPLSGPLAPVQTVLLRGAVSVAPTAVAVLDDGACPPGLQRFADHLARARGVRVASLSAGAAAAPGPATVLVAGVGSPPHGPLRTDEGPELVVLGPGAEGFDDALGAGSPDGQPGG
jgi:Kef-type K+ transport system membrane component KefB